MTVLADALATDCASTPYPLDSCIVSDNNLGSMGDSVRIVHEGQKIRFCCTPCIKNFCAASAKYLAKLP